ncbi:unnamed protein product [Parnassius apollo]|uniref:(apollo) hypothetical protein n=1 Tax=Parnassius apollo TaxID=110799 RepID=A0A8S3X6I0_PARAO|nr:unnamed protein product [Parnassius apollo]
MLGAPPNISYVNQNFVRIFVSYKSNFLQENRTQDVLDVENADSQGINDNEASSEMRPPKQKSAKKKKIEYDNPMVKSLVIGEEFRNRKGYFSLNVQAICDTDLRFMNVIARWPGSTHDATIFNNSILRAQCDAGLFGNRWMLGALTQTGHICYLLPIINPVTEAEKRYNEAHIKTRNVIERTFGVWKRRFPVVALTLRLSLPKVQATIIATAVLHNICRNHNLEEVPSEVELPTAEINEEVYYTEVHNVDE